MAQNTIRLHQYPVSNKSDVIDQYFGQSIADPYRWLEDDHSPETANWVKEQNGMTMDYLSQIPFRDKVNKELTRMWNYTKFSSPFKEGDYYFFYKNDGLQNQSVLYIQKGMEGTPEVFIDPNKLNAEGTSSLGSISVSKNQKYVGYAVSNAGSDWQEIHVMELSSKKKTTDMISYSKFSGISWKGDEGFYYSGYDKPAKEEEKYSAKTEFQKIFYHKMGTPQSADILIYEDKDHPLRYKGAFLSDDERWLMLSISEGTDGSELMYKDLKDKNSGFNILCPGFSTNQEFVDVIDGAFVVNTNFNAPNYKLVLIDPKNPDPKNWTTIVPEKSDKLNDVSRVGNQFFCSYLVKACTRVDVYDLKGKFIRTIELPGLGTASGFGGGYKDDHTFYTYTSFNFPPTIFRYDLKTGNSTLFKKAELKTSVSNTVVTQLWFTSSDGAEVPMFVYHRADVDLTAGPHPTLLYGYGGFNIALTPSFSVPISYFVQQGGVYVVVNLRGGSEFGETWHQQGMLDKKQQVFDDFIGAAEFLIKEGITSKSKLAIHGRSNGGLLVGACMTQRPDLFKVALPGVGVLDMLRYHKFTVGWGWAVEYGSSDKKEEFDYLIQYSPLHNLKKGTKYPATMITTADHDDRVVPAHSFKFAAALQEADGGSEPMLIRIDTQAGHGAGKPTSKQIDEWADMISFTMYHLGMEGFE
ncbi:MAG: S9 family peptidase [Chitinophagaceae bacterium]|nr:S9 family peptidase [Chitinophagaceae bacterium]